MILFSICSEVQPEMRRQVTVVLVAMGPVTTAVGTEHPRSGWRAADLWDGEGWPVLAGAEGQAGLLQEWSGERVKEMMYAC